MKYIYVIFVFLISFVLSTNVKAQTNNFFSNKLIGRWLIQNKQKSDGVSISITTVQDYLSNGMMNQETQYLIESDSISVSCIEQSAYDWSVQGDKQFQTLKNLRVVPDFLKENNIKIEDQARLQHLCNSVSNVNDKHKYVGKTDQFQIISIDDMQYTYQFTDSKGNIVRKTDNRVREGFSFYYRQ